MRDREPGHPARFFVKVMRRANPFDRMQSGNEADV